MTDRARSPKRVHILASINPLQNDGESIKAASPAPPTDDEGSSPKPAGDYDHEPRISKFRFKSKSSKPQHRSHRPRDEVGAEKRSSSPDRHRHRHRSERHHHRRHRRRRSRSPPVEEPDPFEAPPLDSDAAFRESLFDAMADDEGAAYWEGVYGQPIHLYTSARETVNEATGELERMNDDEYAAYVRQRMWEKTHAGLLEERDRRAREREARERKEDESRRIQAEMERSLRRGEERRLKRVWRERWSGYVDGWAKWDGSVQGMAWPLESGWREDIGEETVRSFFVNGLDLEELGEKEFVAKLKEERVRWHPDKIQQKLGGQVDGAVMKDVTAIFQIIDRLWADTRSKA